MAAAFIRWRKAMGFPVTPKKRFRKRRWRYPVQNPEGDSTPR